MKNLFTATLLAAMFVAVQPAIAEEADGAGAGAVSADKKVMQQAFDGAMTCSALAAIRADKLGPDERWVWDNRSFAFGMLAVRFWNDATDKRMTGKQLDEALNIYAGRITEMPEEQRAKFDESCSAKHADVDKLCEVNKCLHAGPPGSADAAPAPPPPPAAE